MSRRLGAAETQGVHSYLFVGLTVIDKMKRGQRSSSVGQRPCLGIGDLDTLCSV